MDADADGHSLSEKKALAQFRENLSDVLPPDITDNVLLKWLRAKNFNLEKSEEIYRTSLRIRQVFRVEEIENLWPIPEVFKKYDFTNYVGIAKDGTPIRYSAVGRADLKGFFMSLDVFDIGAYGALIMNNDFRRCKEQSQKLGRDINEMTYIIDMECFNFVQICFSGAIEIAFDLFRMLQEQCPEIWKIVLVINAPFYFYSAFNIVKPVLMHNLLAKIRVASGAQSTSLLLEYIDDDVLPQFLGGKRVDSKGDPMCSEFMKFGGIIDEEYYLHNRPHLLPTDPGVEDYWVPAKGCLNIPVVVREPNFKIHFEIRPQGGSLRGILMYRKFESDPDDQIDLPGKDEFLDTRDTKHNVVQCGPLVHIQPHEAPNNIYAYAVWPGIYILNLVNSHSWVSGRRCIHRTRVEPLEKC